MNLDQPPGWPQNISVKKKKVPLFRDFRPAKTSLVFGVRKSSWYLGLRTPRDLLISGEFFRIRAPQGTPSRPPRHQPKVELAYVEYYQELFQTPEIKRVVAGRKFLKSDFLFFSGLCWGQPGG